MNDDVTFSADCPTCGSPDATWRAVRSDVGTGPVRITCGMCGPSDPVVVLIKALVRNEGAA